METVKKFLILAAILIIAATPAFAEEEAVEEPAANKESALPVVYSPEGCGFSVSFPEEPASKEICEEQPEKRCQQQINFTKVYDMAATVNFRVICSTIDKEIYSNYSAEIMQKTLLAMTDQNVVKTYDSSFREEDGYKQAGLVGEGMAGQLSTLYIAQLWIGKNSALSLEAELIGEKNDDAEKLFSDVLKSVHFTGDKEPDAEEPAEAKKEEKPEEKKKEKSE